MRSAIRVSALLLAASSMSAQVPHLAGKMFVTPVDGLLGGELCVTNFTPRRDLHILLSAALNIKEVSDGTNVLTYTEVVSPQFIGEAREYAIHRSDSQPPIGRLCTTYLGAVPIFDSNTATTDWKGRLADFKGTLRAAEQTRWYPTLYDSATGRFEDNVTFAIDVHCGQCRSIYLNGAAPVADTVGHFASTTPRTLLLYAGDFGFASAGNATFVGGAARESRRGRSPRRWERLPPSTPITLGCRTPTARSFCPFAPCRGITRRDKCAGSL